MKNLLMFVGAGIIGGLITLGGFQLMTNNSQTALPVVNSNYGQLTTQSTQPSMRGVPADFTTAAEKAMPSVVHIKATQTQRSASRNESEMDKRLREFFGEGFGEFFGGGGGNPFGGGGMPREGSGSGVVIQNNGYIVTNNHVIEGADQLEVTLFDGRQFEAELVGADPLTDLAVIKIDNNFLPELNLANSDEAKVGEWVLAVGNPFNLTSTVTAGIVSAKGRDINIMQDAAAIESFIQTDAAVNPGNSGGALIDVDGNLLGINTAIATRTGYFSGYSFAIPINIVQKVVEDLIEFGEPQRGFLGVNIENMDNNVADELGLNINEGVHVVSLVADGAAADAGIEADDVIIGVNGKDVKSAPELQELVGRKRPGDVVTLTVNRKGSKKDIDVKLKRYEDDE